MLRCTAHCFRSDMRLTLGRFATRIKATTASRGRLARSGDLAPGLRRFSTAPEPEPGDQRASVDAPSLALRRAVRILLHCNAILIEIPVCRDMAAAADSRGFRAIRLLAVATICAVGIGIVPSIGTSSPLSMVHGRASSASQHAREAVLQCSFAALGSALPPVLAQQWSLWRCLNEARRGVCRLKRSHARCYTHVTQKAAPNRQVGYHRRTQHHARSGSAGSPGAIPPEERVQPRAPHRVGIGRQRAATRRLRSCREAGVNAAALRR